MTIGAVTFPVEGGRLDEVSEALVSDRPSQGPVGDVQGERTDETRGIPGVLVGDAQRERTFEQSILEIHGYRDLGENWDTYGGLGASQQAVQFSAGLLDRLRVLPEISPPRVSPISTGVYIEWRAGDRLLYFEVDEDSLFFVMQEGARRQEDGEDPDFGIGRAAEVVKRWHGADDMSAEGITQ